MIVRIDELVLFRSSDAALLDAGLLTGEVAQVVQLGTTDLTILVDLDAVDVRRLNGEDTLHTHGTRHLANSEALLLSLTRDADDHTAVELEATVMVSPGRKLGNSLPVANASSATLIKSVFISFVMNYKLFVSPTQHGS